MFHSSFIKFRRGWLFWEILALVLVAGTVTASILMPLYDGFLLKRTPDEIVIRLLNKESGGFNPSVITVKSGKLVRLLLIGMDVTHSLVIPELGVNSGPVHPGEKKAVEFTPTKPGVFNFYCTYACSPLHTFMGGDVVVI